MLFIRKNEKILDYEGPKIRTHQQNDIRTDRLAMKYVKWDNYMLVLVCYDALIHKINVFLEIS